MKDLIQSRKFQTMAMGILAVIAVKVAALKGIVLDVATAEYIANSILGLAGAYILAQGAADFGKEGKITDMLATADKGRLVALLGGAVEVAKAVSADAGASEAPEALKESPKADEKADGASADAQ